MSYALIYLISFFNPTYLMFLNHYILINEIDRDIGSSFGYLFPHWVLLSSYIIFYLGTVIYIVGVLDLNLLVYSLPILLFLCL